MYVSRAHPQPIPEFGVINAMQTVVEAAHERVAKRQAKWERNAPKRQSKGIQVRRFGTIVLRRFASCGLVLQDAAL
jgi:hypothetical protein